MIRPQPGPQENCLASPADIVIYGGGAGGGKTWSLLMEPLRHIGNSGFGAVIFRRTSPQITNEGGMWDESAKLYPLLGSRPNQNDLSWQFSRGGRVSFHHLQHEKTKYDWQGAQIPLIGFDELTHFSSGQFWYLVSRNRSMCGVRPYVRATCNPDPDSWVATFIEYWINQDTGFPLPERSGKIRWVVRDDNELIWADRPGELRERFPKTPPKSVTFIPASVYDNKILLKENPEYLGNLMAQPLVERERLLNGNWKIRASAGKVFNRAWFEIVDAVPAGGEECRGWDFAATEADLKGDDPDYTASVRMRRVNGIYYITDATEERLGPAAVDRTVKNLCFQDADMAAATGTRYMTRWEIEPGSAAIRESKKLVALLAGLVASGKPSQGDKLTRAKALAAQAEAGNVKLLRGAWNERFLRHMHAIPDAKHDDTMDAAAVAFNALTGRRLTSA